MKKIDRICVGLSAAVVCLFLGIGAYCVFVYMDEGQPVVVNDPPVTSSLNESDPVNVSDENEKEVEVNGTTPAVTTTTSVPSEIVGLPCANGVVLVPMYNTGSVNEDAILSYDATYRANNGVAYGISSEPSDTPFAVNAVLSGKVSGLVEDDVYGSGVIISNKTYDIYYMSLSNITVSINDTVKLGQNIGTSGTNVGQSELKSHVHIIVKKNNTYVDFTTLVGKSI